MNFKLYQNFPNPFNAQTAIQFCLPRPAIVSLDIYNISGKLVKTLLGENVCQAGSHYVKWDGKNDAGFDVSSGTFFCQMMTNGFFKMKKILLIK
jgi:flagellar hook assembly protein FlgD